MENKLLELLGKEYSMGISYNRKGNFFRVAVATSEHKVIKTFSAFEQEAAYHDVLLCTVEQCVLELKALSAGKEG